MKLDPALNLVAGYPLAMARLFSAPLRAVLTKRATAPVPEPDFKCPSCGYELRVAPCSARYACPRCAVALGPRRARAGHGRFGRL